MYLQLLDDAVRVPVEATVEEEAVQRHSTKVYVYHLVRFVGGTAHDYGELVPLAHHVVGWLREV